MTTTLPGPLTGQRVRRQDGAYLTGRAVYTADVRPAGTTHAVLVRSPHAHARVVAIDTEVARALPGVVAVVTGAEAALHCDEIPHGLDAGTAADAAAGRSRSWQDPTGSGPCPRTSCSPRVPSPTEVEVREALSGNLCRCTGYDAIVDAVLRCRPEG